MIPVCATLLLFGPAQLDTILDTTRLPSQPPARVGLILIEGNTHTHRRVILNQLGFQPGQVLRLAQLDQACRNLTRLGLFDADDPVTVSIRPNAQNLSYWDVQVRVNELPLTGMIGFQSRLNDGPGK